jgi:hypothetical protein
VGHHIIVCPPDAELLGRLRGRAVVVRVPSLEALDRAVEAVEQAGVLLHCAAVESRHPLGLLTLQDRWEHIPIALAVPSLGRVREVVRLTPLIRRMNIRVMVPADSAENLTGLRILASLGVACTAAAGSGRIPWVQWTDLATYALLGLAPHGPVEPFDYLAAHYDPNKRTDFRGVWFDDPARFVHMDGSGRFALSAAELAAGQFAGTTPEDLDSLDGSETYRDRLDAWRHVFLLKDGCASCPGWRICLGAFEASGSEGCRAALAEVLDLVERHQATAHKGQRALWPA